MTIFESRASIILFNILKQKAFRKKFLLPSNICPIVPATFLKANIPFEFIDISRDTLCLDESILFQKLQDDKDIAGVLFVHTFGIELEVNSLFKKIKDINENLFIIDDRCLMIPDFNFDIENSYANLAIFSTGYSKYVDIGWGSFGYIKDKDIYLKQEIIYDEKDLEEFSNQTQISINNNSFFEYKDTNWLGSSSVLYEDFKKYKKEILIKTEQMKKQKELLNKIYLQNLPSEIHLGEKFNNWRFSILVENKEEVLSQVFEKGLFASSHYKQVEYMFKKEYKKQSVAKDVHKKMVNLFNDFRFTEKMAFDIVEIINKTYKA